MLTDVYIELHVPDFKKAIRFYSRLGFKLLWRTEDYLVMRRKRSVLNFYGGSQKVYSHSYFGRFKKTTKCGYGVEIIIPVDRVELIYSSVRKFAKIVQPLQLKKWGRRDFRIVDPFGFYLRITERYEWAANLDARQKELINEYKMKFKEVDLKAKKI
jgi:catechol 2,3-dioxygenase-like lactoylglutathione lyase family enzyme